MQIIKISHQFIVNKLSINQTIFQTYSPHYKSEFYTLNTSSPDFYYPSIDLLQMPTNPSSQEDQFTIPSQIYKSKLPMKQQKIIRKQNLRNKTNIPKMIVDSENQDIEEKQQQIAKRKAKKWWKSFNKKYFALFNCLQDAQTTINKIQQFPLNGQRLESYFQEQFYKQQNDKNRCLLRKDTMRVLLRRQIILDQKQENCLVFFELNNNDRNEIIYEDLENDPIVLNGQKIQLIPKTKQRLLSNISISSFRSLLKDIRHSDLINSLPQSHPDPKKLTVVSIQNSETQIQKLLRLEKDKQSDTFIDYEIKQWTKKYHQIFQQNQRHLQTLAARVEQNIDKRKLQEQLKERQQQVVLLTQKQLLWSQILLLFKKGHKDKTEELLNDALEIITIKEMNMKESQRKKKSTSVQKLKSLFETDCKICFSTENDQKINKVFYCDGCNTSFHQICYGISKQQADQILKMDKFYCDVCNHSIINKPPTSNKRINSSLNLENQSKLTEKSQTKQKKPTCQICCKSNFPMKLIDGHFYHVTCLFMFDFAEVKDSKIMLKDFYNFQLLLSIVMQNEQESGFCQFCLKYPGMKFKCRSNDCNKWYHPICAYLNGIYFDLQRNFRKLKVNIFCEDHQPVQKRNIKNQIYIRRFFCDYKKTTSLTEEDFQEQYIKQIKQLMKEKNRQLTSPSNLLLRKYKTFKTPTYNPLSQPNPVGLKKNPSQVVNYQVCQSMKLQQSMAQSSQQNQLQIQRNQLFHKIDHARFIQQDLDFD